MTDLTPDEIRNYGSRALRGIASEPEIAALVSMSRRTHDAEQRAEQAEADNRRLREALNDHHQHAKTHGQNEGMGYLNSWLDIKTREALATPPEGGPPLYASEAEAATWELKNATDAPQQPDDAMTADALAAFDQLCKDYDVADDDEYYFIRRHLAGETPCPHVRTSDGGTSYCTLAEPGSADRLAEAEALLPTCKKAIETAMPEATGKGVTDWGAVNDALCGIDEFLSGGSNP